MGTKTISVTQFRCVAGQYFPQLAEVDIVITHNKIPSAVLVGMDRYRRLTKEIEKRYTAQEGLQTGE
jgi:PHD/YefM family antitoxin component YafN of YafNO toxin-antitoxin module